MPTAPTSTASARKATAATRKSPVAKSVSRPRTTGAAAADTATSALQVLKDDHRTVERLFAQFEQLGDRAHKGQQDVVERVIRELSMHASIEETVFYPGIRTALAKDDLVLEALEEHHLVKLTLAELDGMSPTAERYVAKMTVLMEMVRHHVEEEEDDLFPKVRDAMSRTDLEQLGTALLEAKRSAPTKPHPHSPDTPPANVLVAAVTTPIDVARSVGEAAIRRVRQTIRS
ncbi:MAG: hemerythrin domain-containing protein [Ilumatobacteraceae bacterium]